MNAIGYRPLALACCLTAAPAAANDAYTTIGAGGLVLSKTEEVAMVREDLDVSAARIAVRYVFRNLTAADVTARVAFPLPAISHGLLMNSPVHLRRMEESNFVGFTVRVDGAAVTPDLQERAVSPEGKDITGEVRRFGFTPNFMPHEWPQNSGGDVEGARKAGLIDDADIAGWSYEPTFHWRQAFPAGRDVVVEHEYTPIVGSGLGDRKGFCVDKGTEAGIRRMWKDDGAGEHFASNDVEYVLKSARTWAGPIREFHLTIRKDAPGTVVSTCLEGLHKTGPTTFEFTKRDFVPKDDLKVLFVGAPRPGKAPR